MNQRSLAGEFEAHRTRLMAVATRTLGSSADAEDAIQETWLRLYRHKDEHIDNLGGWLTRVVGHICIDILRRRATRPGPSAEPLDSETIVTEDDGPGDAAVASDSLVLAMAVVLESLRPEERIAFVLHDMFAVPFAEIGPIVGRSANAAKMAASRARRKLQHVPQPTGARRQRREVVDAFLTAAREGDFDALLNLLDPEVTWHHHSLHGNTVTVGANEVLAAARRGEFSRIEARRVNVNGEPGILVHGPGGKPLALMACTIADNVLVEIVSIVGSARLSQIAIHRRDNQ